MDYGRESLKYYDGSDTSSVVGPGTIGVINTVTAAKVEYEFSPDPDELSGGRDIFALQLGPLYSYTLPGGQTKTYGFTLSASRDLTSIEGDSSLPVPFELRQNYPNPFNPTTRISYSVGRREPVRISVYDVSGKLVRDLVDEMHEPGGYSVDWDGLNDEGSMVGSGVYFCRMFASDFSRSIKIILVK
jgi:hypothetical protein